MNFLMYINHTSIERKGTNVHNNHNISVHVTGRNVFLIRVSVGPQGGSAPLVPALGPRLDKTTKGTVHAYSSDICDSAQTQPGYNWPHTVI